MEELSLNETIEWICDYCDRKIVNSDLGWLMWISEVDPELGQRHTELQLIHNTLPRPDGCQLNDRYLSSNNRGISQGEPIRNFLGSDGLMMLLEFPCRYPTFPVKDVVEIIKRLHIPGYEATRMYIGDAISSQFTPPLDLSNPYFPSQQTIRDTLRFIADNGINQT